MEGVVCDDTAPLPDRSSLSNHRMEYEGSMEISPEIDNFRPEVYGWESSLNLRYFKT